EALSYQVQQQEIVATKVLADAAFIGQLVDEVRVLTGAEVATSAEVAAQVDAAVNRLVTQRLEQLPFIPTEFIIVWSHNARFQVDNSTEEIGVRLDGRLLDDLFAGAVLSTSTLEMLNGLPSISVALVPIDPADAF